MEMEASLPAIIQNPLHITDYPLSDYMLTTPSFDVYVASCVRKMTCPEHVGLQDPQLDYNCGGYIITN